MKIQIISTLPGLQPAGIPGRRNFGGPGLPAFS